MKFWPRYTGEWKKKTADLSVIEKGAYSELLDYCYANECPIPLEPRRIYQIVGAITPVEQKAVDVVLVRFFKKNGSGYVNERVMEELAKWQDKSQKASANANKRWGKE